MLQFLQPNLLRNTLSPAIRSSVTGVTFDFEHDSDSVDARAVANDARYCWATYRTL